MKLDLNIQQVKNSADRIEEASKDITSEVESIFAKLRDIPKPTASCPDGIWSGVSANKYANARWREKENYTNYADSLLQLSQKLNTYTDKIDEYIKNDCPDVDEVLYDVFFDYDKYKEIVANDLDSVVSHLNTAIEHANCMIIPWDFQYRNSLSKYANNTWEPSIIAKTRDKLGAGGAFIEATNTALGKLEDEFKEEVSKIPKNEVPKKEAIRDQIKVSVD